MGHYASDMNSTWEESIDRMSKIHALKKMAQNVPLSAFRAKDIVILHKLFHVTQITELSEKEVEQLHLRITVWRKLNKYLDI